MQQAWAANIFESVKGADMSVSITLEEIKLLRIKRTFPKESSDEA
jgi:hypothetical protein